MQVYKKEQKLLLRNESLATGRIPRKHSKETDDDEQPGSFMNRRSSQEQCSVGPGVIVRLKELASERFVQFHRKGARTLFDEIIAVCRRAGFSPTIVSEADFMASVLTLVESGLCYPSCLVVSEV